MVPELMERILGMGQPFREVTARAARLIHSRSAAAFWESERNVDFVRAAIVRQHEVGGHTGEDVDRWLDAFGRDKHAAAFDYWCEIQKGIQEAFWAEVRGK
jgi:glyceraldehyde-3-phosphate dehydrogenase (ferredoxin)